MLTVLRLHGATSAELRAHHLTWFVAPQVVACLADDPGLASVTLAVAAYWNDEARDAVHTWLVPSRTAAPTWPPSDPFDAALHDRLRAVRIALWGRPYPFHLDNTDLIPAYAAFCRPHAHQEMSGSEAYRPFAVLRRAGETVAIEVVGEPLRGGWEDAFARPSWATDPSLVDRSPRLAAVAHRKIGADELLSWLIAEDELHVTLPVFEHALEHLEATGRLDPSSMVSWADGRDDEGPVPATLPTPLAPGIALYGHDPAAMRTMAVANLLAPLGQRLGATVSLVFDPSTSTLRAVRGHQPGPSSAEVVRCGNALTGGRGWPTGPTVRTAWGRWSTDRPVVVATWRDGDVVLSEPVAPEPPRPPAPDAWTEVERGAVAADLLDALAMVARSCEEASWTPDEREPARAALRAVVERTRGFLYP
jgi:hypothetical protein